jgi:DNA invertase Pin-like site-specific DNA recombinase
MKRVWRGEIKGILTWKLDRLSRNPVDGGAIIHAFDENRLSEIISPGGTFRNTSNDKMSMQIDLCMAKKYVDDLSDNVKRGNRTKLEKGWLPGRAPLGYLNDPIERTIVPDPERFHLVRNIWDLLLQGVLPDRIQRTARDEWQLRTRLSKKTGNNTISRSAIYKILGNPFYYGLIQRKDGVFPGKHKRMITEDEYWRTQEILGRKGRPRPKTHQFAFTGLIHCGECGCMITAEEKDNAYGRHYVYYRCSKKKDGYKCRQKYANAKDLEFQVMDYLDKLYVPNRLLEIAQGNNAECEKEELEKTASARRSLERALADCRKKLGNLNHMRLNDLIDDEEYSTEKRRLTEERMRTEERLGNDHTVDSLGSARETLGFGHCAKDRFQNGSLEDKRSILMAVGSNFFLRDKKLLIQAKKPMANLKKMLSSIRDENGSLELADRGSIEPKLKAFVRQC